MIKYSLSALVILVTTFCYGQDFNLSEENVKKFNLQIEELLKKYDESKPLPLLSIPQTSGHYFEIYTKSPKTFIETLYQTNNFDQLKNKFSNLIVDENILIVKTVNFDFKNQKELEIRSFDISNSPGHLVTFRYTDSLNNDSLQFFYNRYTDKALTKIYGFFLKSNFKSIKIPEQYSKLVKYNDVIIDPSKPIFFNPPKDYFNNFSLKKNPIDALIKYFNSSAKKPPYNALDDQELFLENIENWKKRKHLLADSLFHSDKKFKKMLLDAVIYAEKNSITNEDLEDMIYTTLPKPKVLNLLRQSQMIGTCSFDDRPLERLKRIATLAAETSNFSLFIKSSLNILNDNVSRFAQSNIASYNRKTYVEELAKLNFNLNSVLIGSSIKVEDNTNAHYFSDGSKIAKAYSVLPESYQNTLVNTINEILKNPNIDAFNKLHFYNIYQNYKYLINDSSKIVRINQNIENLLPYLPYEIKSRIENKDKLLTDMLFREKSQLDKFTVLSSNVGSIYSYNYGGMCWKAELKENNDTSKIIYDLTMPINEEITPLKNFMEKMDSLKLAVLNHKFLQQILQSKPKTELHIEFTKDSSFTDHNNYTTKDMPLQLFNKLKFENAISLYIQSSNSSYTRYVLLANNQVLSIKSSRDINIKDFYILYNENGDILY